VGEGEDENEVIWGVVPQEEPACRASQMSTRCWGVCDDVGV